MSLALKLSKLKLKHYQCQNNNMEEENFNWIEAFIQATEKKDIKNSHAFQVLNENNIDSNELTKHEKDKNAGVIELNYKDEKEKEVDKRSFAKGALAFVADMPEETMKALMMAFLNGTDVAANFTGVVFNAMTNQSPAMAEAFKNGNAAEFKKLVNGSIQEFSKYLSNEKEQVKAIGEGSELDSKVAEFVSMLTQDTPYSLPIYKKLKNLGMPNYMALPVAYGMGSGISFSDDANLFLNSEQVQNIKELSGALPNSSEEKIFNTVYRTFEGTSLGFLTGPVIKALSYAKKSIPKYMDNQMAVSVGSAASVTAAVDKLEANEEIKEPTTDAEIDEFYGEGASENAMIEAIDLTDANIDKIYGEGGSEKAMDDVLLNKEKEDNFIILNTDKQTSYKQ